MKGSPMGSLAAVRAGKPTNLSRQDNQSREFGRYIGLGQCPEDPNDLSMLAKILDCGFRNVPVLEYWTWSIDIPITDDAVSGTFGSTIDLIAPQSVLGVSSFDTSFLGSAGLLQTDFLMSGYGLHLYAEPESFATIGNAIAIAGPNAVTAPLWSPDVFTANDLANGSLGVCAPIPANACTPANSPILPAELWWGGIAWDALWHFANAFRFIWRFCQRFYLVDEMVANIGYMCSYACSKGHGDSDIPIQRYVKRVNDRYRALGSPVVFEPVNARRVGSVGAGAANTGIFHPVRDFDLASVSWGGIQYQDAAGCDPFNKFCQPVLLERGGPIGVQLVAQDNEDFRLFQQALSISEGVGGTEAIIPFDSKLNGLTTAGTAAVGGEPTCPGASATATGQELTMDPVCTPCVNTLAAQRVNTDRVLFKGGELKLAFLMKGWELCGNWRDRLRLAADRGYCGAPQYQGYLGTPRTLASSQLGR